MSAITDKIKTRGHWLITIRPEHYQPEQLRYPQLEPVLAGAVVRRRGWPVPFIDYQQQMRRGDHWIGQDIDAETVDQYEAWRFYDSGQFVHLRAISAFWRTGQHATPVPEGHAAAIEVWEIILYLTEVFELAGRLGLETAQNASVTVTAQLVLPPDTVLVGGYTDRFFAMHPHAHVAPAQLGERRRTMATDQLAGQYGPPAAEMAVDFFNRFGWNTTPQNLQLLQRDLYQNAQR